MGFLGDVDRTSVSAFVRLNGMAEMVGKRSEVVSRVSKEGKSILKMLEGLRKKYSGPVEC